jgi:hypothetical protein
LLGINSNGFCGRVNSQPICNFLAQYSSLPIVPGFYVYYDTREFNSYWFEPAQRDRGGIKFVLELLFPTSEQRDAEASKIESVTYTNLTKGATYKFTSAYKYFWTKPDGPPSYFADYVMWLGHKNNYIGQWKAEIITNELNSKGKVVRNVYATEFDLTEEMIIELPSTMPIDDITVKMQENGCQVCFNPTDIAQYYRIRLVDGADLPYDSGNLYYNETPICHTIPNGLCGKVARIESRLNYGLRLSCPDNILVTGSISRECTHFILTP